MQRNTKLSTGNICKTYLERKKPTSYPQKADHSPATKNKIEHKKATGRLGILPIPNWTIPIITLSETHFAVTFCIFSYTLIIRSLNLVVNGFRLSFLAMER